MTVGVGVLVAALAISALNIGTLFDADTQIRTESDWSSFESSATNVVYDGGDLQLNDSQTSGTYTSSDINYTSDTDTVEVYASIGENNSATVTVQGYDGTDTQTSATSSVTLEDGRNTVDVSSLGSSTTDIQVEFSLTRDTASDESSMVASFASGMTEDTGLGVWEDVLIIAIIGAGTLIVAREFM